VRGRTALARADIGYRELAERLQEHGLKETEASVANKISRERFDSQVHWMRRVRFFNFAPDSQAKHACRQAEIPLKALSKIPEPPLVTPHPSAEWIARQLTEACGWAGRWPRSLSAYPGRIASSVTTGTTAHGVTCISTLYRVINDDVRPGGLYRTSASNRSLPTNPADGT